MVKFEGHGVIWDATQGKPLCEFKGGNLHKKGTFETEDLEVANKLVSMGYEYEGELPANDQEDPEEENAEDNQDGIPSDGSENSEETPEEKPKRGAKKG